MNATNSLKDKCNANSFKKLEELDNKLLLEWLGDCVQLCQPESVYVCDDSETDAEYIRQKALTSGGEKALATKGHTVHFDGPKDQARDPEHTAYLLPEGMTLGPFRNTIERQKGLKELDDLFKDSMAGKEMYILFFCLGPTGSDFSIPCVQITDSAYVAHSEDILYRRGYQHFKKVAAKEAPFRFLHSAGRLENNVSQDVEKRRIWIDLGGMRVYSINTQYAGNTVGLKKLALRLAIKKAHQEGWLAEHMLLMGIHGPEGRKSYFTGAFPSACGKTSTAMLPGETIVGDDIAYLRKRDGKVVAANVERGIFGIIRDVNPKDDPVIADTITKPDEIIFSNVLINKDNAPRWLGDERPPPEEGMNFYGDWNQGLTDVHGNEVPYAHKNARYTLRLNSLKNVDQALEDPKGVEVKGIIYGGRDSTVWLPVQQSFDWQHGVITMGASLESETTAATLGAEGQRKFDPMSCIDFLPSLLADHLDRYLSFSKGIKNMPTIFSVNYFQKDAKGGYLTAMEDKRVWLKWMELKVNGDVQAKKLPTGYIPLYEDLEKLFRQVLNKAYTKQDYDQQFKLKIPEFLEKTRRIIDIYKKQATNIPPAVFETLQAQEKRLKETQQEHGDYILPDMFG